MLMKHMFLTVVFAFFLHASAYADSLEAPTGEVVLTLTGKLGATNQGQNAVFDLAMLREMGEVTFETTTPWTEGPQSFTGVPLSALLVSVGVTEGTLIAKAINDYSVKFPVSEGLSSGPIIAYERNGKPMSIREKGPLWIVYPYDADAKWRTETVYSYSIWQLISIDVIAD